MIGFFYSNTSLVPELLRFALVLFGKWAGSRSGGLGVCGVEEKLLVTSLDHS